MMNPGVGSRLQATIRQGEDKAKVNVYKFMNNRRDAIDSCENNFSNMLCI